MESECPRAAARRLGAARSGRNPWRRSHAVHFSHDGALEGRASLDLEGRLWERCRRGDEEGREHSSDCGERSHPCERNRPFARMRPPSDGGGRSECVRERCCRCSCRCRSPTAIRCRPALGLPSARRRMSRRASSCRAASRVSRTSSARAAVPSSARLRHCCRLLLRGGLRVRVCSSRIRTPCRPGLLTLRRGVILLDGALLLQLPGVRPGLGPGAGPGFRQRRR